MGTRGVAVHPLGRRGVDRHGHEPTDSIIDLCRDSVFRGFLSVFGENAEAAGSLPSGPGTRALRVGYDGRRSSDFGYA